MTKLIALAGLVAIAAPLAAAAPTPEAEAQGSSWWSYNSWGNRGQNGQNGQNGGNGQNGQNGGNGQSSSDCTYRYDYRTHKWTVTGDSRRCHDAWWGQPGDDEESQPETPEVPAVEQPKPSASPSVKPPVEQPKPSASPSVKPPVEQPKPSASPSVKPSVEQPKPSPSASPSPTPSASLPPVLIASDPAPSASAAPPAGNGAAPSAPTIPQPPTNLLLPKNPSAEDIAGTSDVSKWILEYHNKFRAQYGAPPLTWNPTSAKRSHDWTKQCKWEHMGADNLSQAWSSVATQQWTPNDMLDGWANEYKDFPFNDPNSAWYYQSPQPMVGHFSAMVWKASTTLGCGWTYDCPADQGMKAKVYLTCVYDSPPNYQGQYVENVGKLQAV